MADVLYRTLKSDGYKPKWVMNITDIDDKTIKGTVTKFGAAAGVEQLREFTKFYLDEFLKDLAEVNVLKDEITFIRVTDVIPQIQDFITKLIDKGYAYKAEDGSTYFSIEKYQTNFGDYGQLVGARFLEGKKVGARVAVDEYEKENLSDFALWKAWDEKSDAQIYWDHPELGKGRPGWHIECSVINQIGFKDEPTDIHTGGVDLIFPHHTNEIAQSQPFHKPFSRYWYHNEHLLVDGGRMGKRFNNFYTIKDLKARGFTGQDLRYFYLSSSFITQQNFTFEALAAARTAREKIFQLQSGAFENKETIDEALNDNLNGPQALSVVWSGNSNKKEIEDALGFTPDEAIEISTDLQKLIDERNSARSSKDFKKADELRKQIEALGYELMDTADGQRVKKKITF